MTHRLRGPILLLALAVLPFLPACAGVARSDGSDSMDRGARIWAGTCNRCHNLRPPRQYGPDEWPVIVDHMRTRADLTRSEARAVARYLRQVTRTGGS